MRKSECEEFFDYWAEGSSKVFSYREEFLPTDYLCIRKEKEYIIIEQNTSRNLKELDKDKIIELMAKEELKFEVGYSSYMVMMDLKTGGCTCGSFILGKDTHHDSMCALVKNTYSGWRS